MSGSDVMGQNTTDREKDLSFRQEPDVCWYPRGLRFQCRQCHGCCGGAPGFIWVTPDDIQRMADHIGMDLESFFAEYVRRVGGSFSLLEQGDGLCIMHTGNGCRVYEVRPEQCVKYPFWGSLLDERQSWTEESKRCPGIGKGKLHPEKEIRKRMWKNL